MRTTLDLPDPLFRELKVTAAQRGVALKELIATYIEAGLKDDTKVPVRSRTRSPLPIARKANGSVTPSLTNAEIQKIFDQEDLAP